MITLTVEVPNRGQNPLSPDTLSAICKQYGWSTRLGGDVDYNGNVYVGSNYAGKADIYTGVITLNR
jgi:hypothetical protein